MNFIPKLSKEDVADFCQGRHYKCYDILGAHRGKLETGTSFAVWVPFVKSVRIIGDFNDWQGNNHYMSHIDSGIWGLDIPEAKEGDAYKFVIETHDGKVFEKSDPFAFFTEERPKSASKVYYHPKYKWTDEKWMKKRKKSNHFEKPLNIYEVHLGSWKQKNVNHSEDTPIEDFYTYKELIGTLIPYVKEMGYTHIELLPVMEHPFDGSWGYQLTGFFAPTSRYGTPEDFMSFVNACHEEGIGVILDWVPGHFCADGHGLYEFNGEKLYEKERHEVWGTYKFDFGRKEVRSFLFSSAAFWLDKFHIDGIRVDGVTSMVYLNFGIEDESKHKFNAQGGDMDLEALSFLAELNENLTKMFPGIMSIAEESTALALVTYPPHDGGLGFHYKWDMGWMNDTLKYMEYDFPYREHHHDLLTFSTMYAFNENFILPLSHDEVVHGKKSIIGRMAGDMWRQFAGVRLLHLYQMTHTGAKLSFMGNEIAQFMEWRYYEGIEWFLLEYDKHYGVKESARELNNLYLKQKALWEINYTSEGFEWMEADNSSQGVLIYKRKGKKERDELIIALNFHPHTYEDYRIGVPFEGYYGEIFNSDAIEYGGSGKINPRAIEAKKIPMHKQEYSVSLTLPPLGGVILKPKKKRK